MNGPKGLAMNRALASAIARRSSNSPSRSILAQRGQLIDAPRRGAMGGRRTYLRSASRPRSSMAPARVAACSVNPPRPTDRCPGQSSFGKRRPSRIDDLRSNSSTPGSKPSRSRSVEITFYEMLAGRPPFAATTTTAEWNPASHRARHSRAPIAAQEGGGRAVPERASIAGFGG